MIHSYNVNCYELTIYKIPTIDGSNEPSEEFYTAINWLESEISTRKVGNDKYVGKSRKMIDIAKSVRSGNMRMSVVAKNHIGECIPFDRICENKTVKKPQNTIKKSSIKYEKKEKNGFLREFTPVDKRNFFTYFVDLSIIVFSYYTLIFIVAIMWIYICGTVINGDYGMATFILIIPSIIIIYYAFITMSSLLFALLSSPFVILIKYIMKKPMEEDIFDRKRKKN